MQKNNDILDDIDIEIQEETGTNLQLSRGFVLGVIIQFSLWILTFKFMDTADGLLNKILVKIDIIDYRLSGDIIIVSLNMIMGAAVYLFLSNAKNQPYLKLLPLGFVFSFLAIMDVFIWRSISDGKKFIDLASKHMTETSFITIFYFSILIGIILIFKRKFWYVGAFLIWAGFLLMGFIR